LEALLDFDHRYPGHFFWIDALCGARKSNKTTATRRMESQDDIHDCLSSIGRILLVVNDCDTKISSIGTEYAKEVEWALAHPQCSIDIVVSAQNQTKMLQFIRASPFKALAKIKSGMSRKTDLPEGGSDSKVDQAHIHLVEKWVCSKLLREMARFILDHPKQQRQPEQYSSAPSSPAIRVQQDITSLNAVGFFLLRELTDSDLALEFFERALQLRMALHGDESSEVASSLCNVATVYIQNGDSLRASAVLKRAHSMYFKKLGKSHPDSVACYQTLQSLQLDCEASPRTKTTCVIS
jgi:hypothetical protein